MPKEFKYLLGDWENELLAIATEAIECAVASAYFSQGGLDLLEKVAKRLSKISTDVSETVIRVILSDRFAPTKKERLKIMRALSDLPGVETKIYWEKSSNTARISFLKPKMKYAFFWVLLTQQPQGYTAISNPQHWQYTKQMIQKRKS